MAASVSYEFRHAFRGDAYEWSPRPPEPADPWTRLARHALAREWRIQVADANSRAVWDLRWESVNRAGTRGAGLSVSRSQPDPGEASDPAALASLLEHCRQPDVLLALPTGAWHLVLEGGEAVQAILTATGRSLPQFQLRNLPPDERELLTSLAGLVCLEAAPRPIERATRSFADWALPAPSAPDWLQRVVPPDRSRALEAFLRKNSPLTGVLTRLRHLDQTVIIAPAEVEKAVSDLRKLADLGGAGGVRLRVGVQPPDAPFALRLSQGELLLPIDHERSLRIARILGLDPPASPRPEPVPIRQAPPGDARAGGAAPAVLKRAVPWRDLAIGLTAIAGAFMIGRFTAPRPPSRPPRAPLAEVPAPATRAAVPVRPPRGGKATPVVVRVAQPSLPVALVESPAPAGPDLAEPTCTPNGDVLRTEPARLVIVPCGTGDPREAVCVAGSCRQAGNPDDEPPETACGRDGAALVLDRDQKVFRPASPPTFDCPAAWYGVPAAKDPLITLSEPAAKPRVRPAATVTATFKQNIRSWTQLMKSNPRHLYTVVGYTSGAPRPKEGCARADTRVRAAVTWVMDALIAEQPALKAQLVRPPAVRTCAAAPGRPADQTPAASHLFLVRGFVPGCSCTEIEVPATTKSATRPPDRVRRP